MTTGKATPIVDTVHGHVIATIDLGDPNNATDDIINYKQQQFGGYGPLPGTQQKPLEVTEDLAASLGWQTRCIDPTSFFTMGARHYDPLSGRFLSADPLGHTATPDLYSYANGDPINFLDPTGRGAVAGDAESMVNPLGPLIDAINSVDGVNYDGNELFIKRSLLQDFFHTFSGNTDIPGAEGYDVYLVSPEAAAQISLQQQLFNTAEKIAIAEAVDSYEKHQQQDPDTQEQQQKARDDAERDMRHSGESDTLSQNTERKKSSEKLRREWEAAHKQPWPKDEEGRNYDADHDIPLADGGEDNGATNITPRTREDHIRRHQERGDFQRWGSRSN